MKENFVYDTMKNEKISPNIIFQLFFIAF